MYSVHPTHNRVHGNVLAFIRSFIKPAVIRVVFSIVRILQLRYVTNPVCSLALTPVLPSHWQSQAHNKEDITLSNKTASSETR